MRFILFCVFALLGQGISALADGSKLGVLDGVSNVKSIVFPLGPDCSRPLLQVSCSSINIGRKSFGFFKLGLLPEVIVEGAAIRLYSPDPDSWSKELLAFVKSNPSFARARIRDISISDCHGRELVRAARAQFGSEPGSINLDGVSIDGLASGSATSQTASIPLDGQKAGRIVFESSECHDSVLESPHSHEYLLSCFGLRPACP